MINSNTLQTTGTVERERERERESYSLIDVQKITKLANKIELSKYKKQIELSSICVFLI